MRVNRASLTKPRIIRTVASSFDSRFYDGIGTEGKPFGFPYYLIWPRAYLFSLPRLQVALFVCLLLKFEQKYRRTFRYTHKTFYFATLLSQSKCRVVTTTLVLLFLTHFWAKVLLLLCIYKQYHIWYYYIEKNKTLRGYPMLKKWKNRSFATDFIFKGLGWFSYL